MTTYTLTITEEQARVLSMATDLLARLGIGQFEEALEWLPQERDLHMYLHMSWRDDMRSIGKILSKHMGDGQNLSMNNPQVASEARIAWDLYQVIRHRLAWDRAVERGIIENLTSPPKSPEMMLVCYNAPVKVGDQPLARIESSH